MCGVRIETPTSRCTEVRVLSINLNFLVPSVCVLTRLSAVDKDAMDKGVVVGMKAAQKRRLLEVN